MKVPQLEEELALVPTLPKLLGGDHHVHAQPFHERERIGDVRLGFGGVQRIPEHVLQIHRLGRVGIANAAERGA